MNKGQKILRAWLAQATTQQRRQLSRLAKTAHINLTHIRHGRRNPSPQLAQRLAHASISIKGMPKLNQWDLCEVCRQCPYTQRFQPKPTASKKKKSAA